MEPTELLLESAAWASTSFDAAHPPAAAANSDQSSFWSSTGLLPQSLSVELPGPTTLGRVVVWATGVARARLHVREAAGSQQWRCVDGCDLPDLTPATQKHQFSCDGDPLSDAEGDGDREGGKPSGTGSGGDLMVDAVRLDIESAHSEFVQVHYLSVVGDVDMRRRATSFMGAGDAPLPVRK